jgi:hypothetical protein
MVAIAIGVSPAAVFSPVTKDEAEKVGRHNLIFGQFSSAHIYRLKTRKKSQPYPPFCSGLGFRGVLSI